jgi:hypothetical protein
MKLKRKLKGSWKSMKMKTQPTGTYGTEKAVLRGKFIPMSAYIKKTEKISNQ